MRAFNEKVKIGIFLTGVWVLSGCSLASSTSVFNKDNMQEKGLNKPQETQSSNVSLLFVGDLMFDRYIRETAEKKGNGFIFDKMSAFLRENDLVVANLEGPITDNESISIGTTPGEKGHFSFTFDKNLAETLAKNNIKLVNLGNNHILNFGQAGLLQTENYLKDKDVDYFGDPADKEKKYIVKEIDGIKIGFVNYNQFGGSAEEAANDINNVKGITDIQIVYTHWGKEYEKTPSDKIKNLARSFIDNGADLIIGSHPHVVQDIEEYKGKKIYYSLGNFIFDQYFSAETTNGLAVKVMIDQGSKKLEFQESSLIMDKNGQTRLPFAK